MRPSTAPLVADPSAATVVFMRPNWRPVQPEVVVWDKNGTIIGEADPSSWFMAKFAPGAHEFYSHLMRLGSMAKANLEAGRIYYVFLRTYGYGGDFRVSIETMHPGRTEWASLQKWLKEAHKERIPGAKAEHTAEDIAEWTKAAVEQRAGLTGVKLEERTILPEHGQTQ